MGLARALLRKEIGTISRVKRRGPTRDIKRVLVLGGAGYLGSVLVRGLLRRGFSVRVLDSLLFGSRSLREFNADPSFELIRADIRDVTAVKQSMGNCDAVVHLAAIVGDRACEDQEASAVEVNLTATDLLAELAIECGISRFIFASSCSVYGASDKLLNESSELKPLSIYARTKELSERSLLRRTSADFCPTILRLGTLFGLSPRMRFDLVVNLFVAQAASNQPITICNREQWRPFVHVHDAARAFTTCLQASPATIAGQIFNVGGPSLNYQIGSLACEIARAIPGTQMCSIENEDRRNYRVSFEKIQNMLRFHTQRTLASGIDEIYRSLRSNASTDRESPEFSLNNLQPAPLFAHDR